MVTDCPIRLGFKIHLDCALTILFSILYAIKHPVAHVSPFLERGMTVIQRICEELDTKNTCNIFNNLRPTDTCCTSDANSPCGSQA